MMISTGKKIDPSVKIKQWSAKHMNGTNILGRGSRYVLSNDATGRYYQVTGEWHLSCQTFDRLLVVRQVSTMMVRAWSL